MSAADARRRTGGEGRTTARESPLRTLQWLARWARLLDSEFRVPGTNIRFGIDPILDLIPGIGDAATPVFTVLLLAQGVRQGVPRVVLLRMIGNALIDAIIGIVPVAGTVGDVFWRANLANLSLLEKHRHPAVAPSRADYAFVWMAAAVLGLLVAIPIALGMWVVYYIGTHLL